MSDDDGGDADAAGRPRGGPGHREEVGSLGEEASRLLAALQDWARESGVEYAEATVSAAAGAASAAADRVRDIDEHLATGGRDCTYCPVCQVIALVRGTSPEVRDHLRTAATSLLEAAAAMLATPTPGSRQARRSGVEKIDLSDEWEDE